MKVLKIIIAILGLSFLASCSNTEDPRGGVQKYSITFDTDGGSLVLAQEVEWGECATKPGDPAKTGYTFLGWYNGENPYYFSQAVVQDLSLKAKWRVNSYKITFDKNGAIDNSSTMSKVLCTYDVSYSLPANTFTSTGSTFLGWGTEKDGELFYSDCDTVKNLSSVNGETVTLYAIWSKNEYHKINYKNLYGIENSTENPRKFLEDQPIVILPPSERTGFSFDGWYLNPDYTGSTVSGWISGTYTNDITLYAKWAPLIYKITLNDRDNLTEINLPFGETIPDFTIPEVSDATFGGFYAQPYANGAQYINNSGIGIKAFTDAKNITIYAVWEYKLTYVIDNPDNIGYLNQNPLSYTGGSDIDLVDLTLRNGYKFYGWQDEQGKKITKIPKGTSGARTLTSRGLGLITYSITYNKNEGEWDTSDGYMVPQYFTVESDELLLPSKENIKKDGFVFEGWYTTQNFSGQKVTSVPKGSVGDLILYAKWIEE